MTTADLIVSLPPLHPAQRAVAASPARFKVLAAGRRFGKTMFGILLCLAAALAGKRAWWVAPSYKMSAVGWRGLKRLARQIPRTEIREADKMILFPGGGWVQIRTGHDPDSLRGEGLDLAVLDEAAFMDERVWTEAIRPALADRKGCALFISSPNGQNWFWGLFMLGQNPAYPDWASWAFPTRANPFIDAGEIEEARRTLPERVFQQEFQAEFLTDGGAVFRRVREAIRVAPEAGPIPGERYVFGVDWGRYEDWTAIAVMAASNRRLVALDRFNEIGWTLQRGRLDALARHWKPDLILAEANSIGEPNIEMLQAEGLPVVPFWTTTASKGPLVDGLALAFERGDLAIFDEPTLIAELQAYTLERLPSGRFTYNAPPGQHDDLVVALALAWQGAMVGTFEQVVYMDDVRVSIGGY